MREIERVIEEEGLNATVCGYADDHFFSVDNAETAEKVLKLFRNVCLRFGMILESSKTELISTYPCKIQCEHEDSPGRTVTIQSKQSWKWLGFYIHVKNNRIEITLNHLKKYIAYLDELRNHVNDSTFKEIFRIYVQSGLNYYYPMSAILCQEDDFINVETLIRATGGKNLENLSLTSEIMSNQTEMLKNRIKSSKPFNLR